MYSFLSLGSVPSKMPTVFGAVSDAVTVSFSSRPICRPGSSRETPVGARRRAATCTPAVASAFCTAPGCTWIVTGLPVGNPMTVRSGYVFGIARANAAESASVKISSAFGPARYSTLKTCCMASRSGAAGGTKRMALSRTSTRDADSAVCGPPTSTARLRTGCSGTIPAS
jgi:hypothetical protein